MWGMFPNGLFFLLFRVSGLFILGHAYILQCLDYHHGWLMNGRLGSFLRSTLQR